MANTTMEEKIKRINELYHKSQKEGLTDAEKEEKQALYKDYLAAIRGSIKSQLDNIDVVEKDGSITNLGEAYNAKSNK